MNSSSQSLPHRPSAAQAEPAMPTMSSPARPDRYPRFYPENMSRAFACRPRTSIKKCMSLRYLPSFLLNDQIRVVVQSATTFKIFDADKTNLCDASGYFRNALSGRWETNNEGDMKIEDDPVLFELFLHYATFGKLSRTMQCSSELDMEYIDLCHFGADSSSWPVRLDSRDYTKTASDAPRRFLVDLEAQCFLQSDFEAAYEYGSLSFEKLIELYIFADRRDAPGLADYTVSIVLEKISLGRKLPMQAINQLLENTAQAESGLMFKMLTDIAARFVDANDIIKSIDELPAEFIIGVVQRQREHINKQQEWNAKNKVKEEKYMVPYNPRTQSGLQIPPFHFHAPAQIFKACRWHLHPVEIFRLHANPTIMRDKGSL